jgi:predicted phage terminase large subunit-like protein
MGAYNHILEWAELSIAEKAVIKDMSLQSFLDFTKIWFEIDQGENLRINWHHQMMADAAESVISRSLHEKNLIINVPPGGTKTEFFSVHLPAYLYARQNEGDIDKYRNLNISFSDTLVKRNSRRTRDLISSSEFQEVWPSSFGVNQAEEWDIRDEAGKVLAQTISRASGGQVTGTRAGHFGAKYSGHIMLDDYNKPDDMFSETKRKSANRLLVNTIRSRRGDKSAEHPTPIISIQQRLHVQDATGFMMSNGMGMSFKQVVIPALISKEYIDSLDEPYRKMCWETVKDTDFVEVGGIKYWSYWPDMESVHDLLALWERDEYTFLSQYQQEPKELTGNLVDTAKFKRYDQLPELEWRAIYVDTNSGKIEDHNDYTVFTLAGKGVDGNMYIIDVERGKWDPEQLLHKAIEVWDKWKTDADDKSKVRYMAIEDKQAGQGLITTLKKKRVIPLKQIPRGAGQNKLVRCQNVIPQINGGEVFIPQLYNDNGDKVRTVVYSNGSYAGETHWVPAALAEVAGFSADDSHENDDIWDTWMDAIDDMLIGERKSRGFFDF